MKLGISANPNKPRALALARHVMDRVGDRAELVLTPETAAALQSPRPPTPFDALDVDVLVVLGGDGTFLWTLQRTERPILAVHAGTVGFLAEIDGESPAAFDAALERVLSRDYRIEERMKLGVQLDGRSLPDATNEVVLHTSQVAKIRHYEIAVDGRPLGRLRADGIILATPTGSTSYSLSAMGPIVDPALEAILVAALAPFQVAPRSVLIDPLRTVSVQVVAPARDAVVVIDGQEEHPMAAGSRLLVYRSPRRASFVRLGRGFFDRLRGTGLLPWRDSADHGGDRADLPPAA